MLESLITSFIIFFVVIKPIGNAAIFLAMTKEQNRARKLRAATESNAIATAILLIFALRHGIFTYLNINQAAFKIACGIILFLGVLDMLAAKHQKRNRAESTDIKDACGPKSTILLCNRWSIRFCPVHRLWCR